MFRRRNAALDKMSPLVIACIVTACSVAACGNSPRLEEGRWTGALTPMNHPDMANPVQYDVSYDGDVLTLLLIGPDGDSVRTDNPRLVEDTLFFTFDEPEEDVRLDCALGRRSAAEGGFAGRCTDPTGQWARFTMNPPD